MHLGRVLPHLSMIALCGVVAAATRFEEFTKKFEKTPDRAEVLAATYLGGSGTEWLVSGGVQPDGTIVAAGVCLGPELNLGIKATVLGKDLSLVPPPRNVRRERMAQFRPDVPSWNHPNATAFIARLAPDLKTIQSVTRLGWRCGGLTSAVVDRGGNIYVCGPAATNGIATIAAAVEEFTAEGAGVPGGGCDYIYVARISPDGAHAVWLRTIKGPSGAPKLRLLRDDALQVVGADIRLLALDGRLLASQARPLGASGHLAISPVDGSMAVGGEHHWSTGREPYRDPVLNIYDPSGAWRHELYNWDGPLVGLNSLRLVSDSAIRGIAYDAAGNLVIHAWSDGGNSVLYCEPNDVFSVSKKMSGLGLSAWGAGVLSCGYIIRIETTNYTIANGALWVGYLKTRDKPNSATINSMGLLDDGSVCIGGTAAFGLIQTGNAIGAEPAGPYVAVMNRDLTSLRFCSTLPSTGLSDLGDGARYGVASGMWNGKPVALFFCGAELKQGQPAAPVKNARQSTFAGGASDGYLLLLDLSSPH